MRCLHICHLSCPYFQPHFTAIPVTDLMHTINSRECTMLRINICCQSPRLYRRNTRSIFLAYVRYYTLYSINLICARKCWATFNKIFLIWSARVRDLSIIFISIWFEIEKIPQCCLSISLVWMWLIKTVCTKRREMKRGEKGEAGDICCHSIWKNMSKCDNLDDNECFIMR